MSAKRTHIKAWVLLLVFSLNTIVSTACSFSSFFHEAHHHTSESKHHEHGDGIQHDHNSDSQKHDHSDSGKETKDDCCSKSVVALDKLDKTPSKTIDASIAIFSLLVHFNEYFIALAIPRDISKPYFSQHVRWRLPATIQDLRIVMQSFQI